MTGERLATELNAIADWNVRLLRTDRGTWMRTPRLPSRSSATRWAVALINRSP